MKYINLNGNIKISAEAIVPVDNGAFRYGYGLYETMLVQDGAIRLKQYHWDRLFAGLRQLYFDLPAQMTPEWLEQEVICIVEKNLSRNLCRVRVQMFADGGGLYNSEPGKPAFIIECFPVDKHWLELNENGLVAGVARGLNKSMDELCNLKSCNALIYAMGARQAREFKWNDALVSNTSGNIIESILANIFWIRDEVVYTPPLSDGCVAGVMRRHVMETLGNVVEKSLQVEELQDADEVFLTNSIKKVRWIGEVDNKKYGNEQTKKIYSVL